MVWIHEVMSWEVTQIKFTKIKFHAKRIHACFTVFIIYDALMILESFYTFTIIHIYIYMHIGLQKYWYPFLIWLLNEYRKRQVSSDNVYIIWGIYFWVGCRAILRSKQSFWFWGVLLGNIASLKKKLKIYIQPDDSE